MSAALHVMRRNGFQGASVQDILDRAGLSTRAFYRQFRSKDDLLLAMFATASAADVSAVARQVAAAPTPTDALEAWLDEMLAMAYDRRRMRRLVMFNPVARQTVGYEEEEMALRERFVAPLCRVLAAGAEDGTFPLADPVPDAHSVFDLVWSVASPTSRELRPMSVEQAKAHVLRFCLPALGASPLR